MSEAYETASNMIARFARANGGAAPSLGSHDEAVNWVKAQWPDWNDWIGHVMLDNIATHVFFKRAA